MALGAAAAGQPDAAVVQTALTSYYAAINAHDYDAWLAASQPAAAKTQTRTGWESGYRSSQDDDVVIEAITPGPGGNDLATVSMRSTQDPADAPSSLPVGRICWTLTLPVDPSTGKVGVSQKGSTTMAAC
ncbi:hypothetical protein [Actinomycetospora chiangmaiensis]|uniref:hypothetical protein n=1 Tax=Actinomycetospora chiangmaiensis TaxID=402650 RepID=UPI0003A52B88|nr:hypothetical protein [Actinomycetospora chiangmaiensis]